MNLFPYSPSRKKRTVKKSSISLTALLREGKPFRVSSKKPKERWDALDSIRNHNGLDVCEMIVLCNGFGDDSRNEGSTFLINHAPKKYWEMCAGSRAFIEYKHQFGYRHMDKVLSYPHYQIESKDADSVASIKSGLQSLGYVFQYGQLG